MLQANGREPLPHEGRTTFQVASAHDVVRSSLPEFASFVIEWRSRTCDRASGSIGVPVGRHTQAPLPVEQGPSLSEDRRSARLCAQLSAGHAHSDVSHIGDQRIVNRSALMQPLEVRGLPDVSAL